MTYVQLAGFWSGHKAPDEGSSLVIGGMTVSRRESGGVRHVRVREHNSTSGLETEKVFQTDKAGRMTGAFSLDAKNTSPDLFRGCRITGMAEASGLQASFHGREHTVSLHMPASGAPYFFTELFEALPSFHRQNGIAVTYDFTKIYPACYWGRMESARLSLGEWQISLEGWYFAGRGVPTVFLWYDDAGLLTLIGSTLYTYVLQEAIL